ncbi:L-threonylcarbamoyladenylate synthase [Candidatus Nanohalococcus occultus]|uniref:L-threonylcarbamoyladenylate synthase n=1 Tax=Candidatus Nanohalococcus occultus TaxID=2978047 RepID=A0ABY8CDA6_9ARCH|nr:tRNA A37 threonylcarbamoyladenosine synthetase subunit TsaC/SUA5/YrdC [Candidatus Nanohaloarchaeota archaeon SVXNc]
MDLEQARKTIEDGGIIIFPTETAYGIAADARNPEAVEKVYKAKERPRSKGLTTIVSSLEQAEKYGKLTEDERAVIAEFMPGPLTLVTRKKKGLAENINEDFVFRISSGETARELAEEFPITATSANISGEDTSYAVEDISEELLEKVDGVIDVGELEDGPTSSIIEIVDGEVKTYRQGPIKSDEIEKVIR